MKKVYMFLNSILVYALVMSIAYNIYQASIIEAYEQNFDGFLQEIMILRGEK